MSGQTNPRKVFETGGMSCISLPSAFLEAEGIEKGDKFVLEGTENGFKATKVEMVVSDG